MLSCSCDYESEWYYYPTDDFINFECLRRKRCVSCRVLIDHFTPCLEFECFRDPYNDIEERIWGTEVQIASRFMCEKCGEIYLNLDALGYCHNLETNIQEDLKDYWDLTGFAPKPNLVSHKSENMSDKLV